MPRDTPEGVSAFLFLGPFKGNLGFNFQGAGAPPGAAPEGPARSPAPPGSRVFSGGWRSPPRGRGRVAFWGFRWGKLVRKSLAGAGGYSEEPCQALGAAQRLCFSRSHTYIQQARVWEVDLPGLPQVLSDRTRAIISPRFLWKRSPTRFHRRCFFRPQKNLAPRSLPEPAKPHSKVGSP